MEKSVAQTLACSGKRRLDELFILLLSPSRCRRLKVFDMSDVGCWFFIDMGAKVFFLSLKKISVIEKEKQSDCI